MIAITYRADLADAARKLKSLLNASELDCSNKPEKVVVLGGDGTLLETIHRYPCVLDSLVFHIGGGRINFYRTVRVGEMSFEEIAKRIAAENYNIIDFSLINTKKCFALNEIIIRNLNYKKLLMFKISSNSFSISGRADGVVIATPHGSTGYAVSAGGPIVDVKLDALIISFIAPYTLYLRPLVVPPETIEITTYNDAELSCDGYEEEHGREFVVNKSDRRLHLAVFGEFDYYERVSQRLISL
ncbi:NAD(+)/NADH kinase [Thermoproteus tenax]|uniref:NAD(+)/NADH kinase n=1 Tax=Thermoproteus tenax TaxID=2271 RepID=UPI0006995BBE|nr:NAD(+)/NADH kinase [Thermoproteus tenax]